MSMSASSSSIDPLRGSANSSFSTSINTTTSQVNTEAITQTETTLRLAGGDFSKLSKNETEQVKKIGPAITSLDLSFKCVPQDSLDQFPALFPNLQNLSLANVATLEEVPFLKNLKRLDVSSTPVSSLRQYTTLREVALDCCREFQNFSIALLLSTNENIEKASLSYSHFDGLQSNLPQLTFLNCSHCLSLIDSILDNLINSPKLDTLLLQGTEIQSLPAKLPVKVLDLDCCKNLHMNMLKAIKTYSQLENLTLDLVYVQFLESATVKNLKITLNDFTSTSEQIAEKVTKTIPIAIHEIRKRCPKLENVEFRIKTMSDSQQQSVEKQLSPSEVQQSLQKQLAPTGKNQNQISVTFAVTSQFS